MMVVAPFPTTSDFLFYSRWQTITIPTKRKTYRGVPATAVDVRLPREHISASEYDRNLLFFPKQETARLVEGREGG